MFKKNKIYENKGFLVSIFSNRFLFLKTRKIRISLVHDIFIIKSIKNIKTILKIKIVFKKH